MKSFDSTLRDVFIGFDACSWTVSNVHPDFEHSLFVVDWAEWPLPAAELVPEAPLSFPMPDWAVRVLSAVAVGSCCRERRELVGYDGWCWLQQVMAVRQMLHRAMCSHPLYATFAA